MVREHRRLAAILAADVAGYSRLMGIDESGTLSALKSHRRDLVDRLIQEHGGRIVKTAGDGMLVEFASVVDAVNCAVGIQQGMWRRNADIAPERRIEFRIGVNLGDIVIDDGDLFGDGVNVAARLEALSRIGGICLSGKAREEIRGKLDVELVDGGEQSLKNIAAPVRVYHWAPAGAPLEAAPAAASADGRPSVRLLPLEPGGDSDAVRSLAATVGEEIAVPLANLTGLRLVTGDGPSDYLLKGRVQSAASQARVTLSLLDRASQQQFWSGRFEADLSDVFSAMDELALRVSTAVRFEIHGRETAKAESLADDDLSDVERKAKAGHILLGSKRSDWERSRALIEPVIARHPDDFMALAIRAVGAYVEAVCGWREIEPRDARLGLELARKAIALNERSDFAHVVLGSMELYCERDVAAALREADRALELNPHYALGMDLRGVALTFAGDADAGVALSQRALDAGPRFPASGWFMQSVALAHLARAEYRQAIEWCRRADQRERDVPRCLLVLIAAAFHAGEVDMARGEAARLLGTNPDFGLRALRRWPFQRAEDWSRFVSGLRDSGLPD